MDKSVNLKPENRIAEWTAVVQFEVIFRVFRLPFSIFTAGIRRARASGMMPGGHLATSIALSGLVYASTGSPEAATGCIAGGFLIDVDHYFDYLVFEKQWRRPGPLSFLRYYFGHSPKKLVLPLHSAEVMAVLLFVILWHPWPLLVGYWLGALMHLFFDVLVNGDHVIKEPIPFYVFTYRASVRFAAEKLLDLDDSVAGGRAPVREFFSWRPVVEEGSQVDSRNDGQPSAASAISNTRSAM